MPPPEEALAWIDVRTASIFAMAFAATDRAPVSAGATTAAAGSGAAAAAGAGAAAGAASAGITAADSASAVASNAGAASSEVTVARCHHAGVLCCPTLRLSGMADSEQRC